MKHATLYDVFFHPFPILVYILIVFIYFAKKMYNYYKKIIQNRGRLWFYSEDFFFYLPFAGVFLVFSLTGFLIHYYTSCDLHKLEKSELNLCIFLLFISLATYVYNYLRYRNSISIYVLKFFASIVIGLGIIFVTGVSTSPVWLSVVKKYINNKYFEYILVIFSLFCNYLLFIDVAVSGGIIKIFKCLLLGIANITFLSCVYIFIDKIVLKYVSDVTYINSIMTIICGIIFFYMKMEALNKVKHYYGSLNSILYTFIYAILTIILIKVLRYI